MSATVPYFIHSLTYNSSSLIKMIYLFSASPCPGPVDDLGILPDPSDGHLDEVVVVVVLSPKHHLADDVGGQVVEQLSRTDD